MRFTSQTLPHLNSILMRLNLGNSARKLPLMTKRYVVLGTQLSGNLTHSQRKTIGLWLLGCAGMVYGAVALGGVTRLTESGLSMVNWDLVRSMIPPIGEKQWNEEFERYKLYPEYDYKSSMEDVTLSKFKFIWYMEYIHRMWGRLTGLVFFVPCMYFWARRRFIKPMKIRMLIAGSLLFGQGLIGWWMVKSGLNPSQNSDAEIPRVSQYRLATHLTMAFVLYTIFLWTGLSHTLKPYDHTKIPGIKLLQGMTHSSKTLLVLTAVIGAFVAGLDAGYVYNSWPKFADNWIPEDIGVIKPYWRNIFENAAAAQFTHRNLAYLTLLSITVTWLIGRRMNLSRRTKIVLHSLMGMGYLQVLIGIYSLLYYVPVWLGALHQSGSMAAMTLAFWLSNEIRRIPK